MRASVTSRAKRKNLEVCIFLPSPHALENTGAEGNSCSQRSTLGTALEEEAYKEQVHMVFLGRGMGLREILL